MKSFGLWYLAKSNEGDTLDGNSGLSEENSRLNIKNKETAEEDEKPKFDLHVNFWS